MQAERKTKIKCQLPKIPAFNAKNEFQNSVHWRKHKVSIVLNHCLQLQKFHAVLLRHKEFGTLSQMGNVAQLGKAIQVH